VTKTWSPAGTTPVLSAPLLREHLSVIGGLTWQGSLYVQVPRTAINAEGAIDFVRHLCCATFLGLCGGCGTEPASRRVVRW
jgi:hypothetical protein